MTRLKACLALTIVLTAGYAAALVSAQSPDRGALVLIKDDQSRLFVKVLVAVPGDTVSVSAGRVVVNGAMSDLQVDGTGGWGPRKLAESEYFVAGDPLELNADPTAWGIVGADSVLGTVQPRR